MLRNGTPAPEFSAFNSEGEQTSLSALRGRPVVLIFTRGQFCPTTDRFLTAWQDFYKRIGDLDMELLAISTDSVDTNIELKQRLRLSLPLLSDPEVSIANQYGVYIEDKHSGGQFAEPALFVIDKDGDIAYSIISSGPKGLPDPGAIAPILVYMHTHGGKY